MNFPPLPRRRFLAACVATAGLVTLPSARAASGIARLSTPVGTLLVLDAHAVSVLEAFAEATIATGNGFPSIRDTGMARRIDEELFFAEPGIRNDVLLAIRAIDYLPILYGRFSRLQRMDAGDRRAFLESLADTRLDTVRALHGGLRLVTGLVYHAHPATWAAMGYDGTHAGLPPRETEQQAHYKSLTGKQA